MTGRVARANNTAQPCLGVRETESALSRDPQSLLPLLLRGRLSRTCRRFKQKWPLVIKGKAESHRVITI